MGTITANSMVARPPSAFAALVAMLFTACPPHAVASHYATLADARADQLFARGWLPDILPESTTGIRTSNDMDINRSTGRFRMAPADIAAFAAHSTEGAPAQSPLSGWQAVVAGYASDGMAPWTLRRGGSTWVFFCNASTGECQYLMW